MYTVVVTDDAGCQRSERVTINEIPAFEVNISVAGNVLTADVGELWQWYLNGVVIPGATAISYTAIENGNYSVMVTDGSECVVFSEEINIVLTSLYEIEGLSLSLIHI